MKPTTFIPTHRITDSNGDETLVMLDEASDLPAAAYTQEEWSRGAQESEWTLGEDGKWYRGGQRYDGSGIFALWVDNLPNNLPDLSETISHLGCRPVSFGYTFEVEHDHPLTVEIYYDGTIVLFDQSAHGGPDKFAPDGSLVHNGGLDLCSRIVAGEETVKDAVLRLARERK